MKRLLLLSALLLLNGFYSIAQQNEITTLLGVEPNGKITPIGDVFQLKYTRKITSGIELQTGLRYHNYIEPDKGLYSNVELIIEKASRMYKLDVTAFAVPIEKEHFKFKVGIGGDIGYALYAIANESRIRAVETKDGIINKQYWRGVVAKTPEYGVHFVISPNYYFNNQMFLTAQAFYDQIFEAEKFSPPIYREGLLVFNIGVGFTF